MQIKIAQPADLNKIYAFYQQVCADQKTDEYSPDWHWGMYPSEAGLKNLIKVAKLVIAIENGQVISAGVLNQGTDPNYLEDEQSDVAIVVLHLFAVAKRWRGQGVAGQMIAAFEKIAKEAGYDVIYLDVMKGNLPAEKAYSKYGFEFVREAIMHYEDDGDTPALIYRKMLQ